jgi:L-amino acid N-acyltransferase YncA
MTAALHHFLSKGYRGLICYIEANNTESLKGSFRAGYVPFGSIYMARIFGRWIIASSRGCRRFGFQIAPASGDQSRGVRLAS